MPMIISAALMMIPMVFSCIGIPSFRSEGGVVFGFSLLETPAVGLDELKGIGDELVGALGYPLVGFPDMAIQRADDGDFCPFVKAPCSNVGELLEANDPDPAGLLLGAVKSDVETGDGISLGGIEDFRICT